MKKVLVCDDEAVNRTMLTKIFESADAEVLAVDSGSKLIEKSHVFNPDLIILDIVMPEMDGIETLQTLQQKSAMKHTPVVMLTGKGDQETVLKAVRMGAAGFMVKPIQKKKFLTGIGHFLLELSEEQVRDTLKKEAKFNPNLLQEVGIKKEAAAKDASYMAEIDSIQLCFLVSNNRSLHDLDAMPSGSFADYVRVYAKGQLKWHRIWPNLLDFLDF